MTAPTEAYIDSTIPTLIQALIEAANLKPGHSLKSNNLVYRGVKYELVLKAKGKGE